jgi:4-alpha-glucanotransferase
VPPSVPGLAALARAYGVQTAFYDVDSRRRPASPDALIAVLRGLGAPLESPVDVPDALRHRRQSLWARPLEPVSAVWQGAPPAVPLRLPASAEAPISCSLALEGGGQRRWQCDPAALEATDSETVEGVSYRSLRLPLPADLPAGYHRLTIEAGGARAESLVILAPPRCFDPKDRRSWGAFLPLYALRSERSAGPGDLAGLGALVRWVGGLGAGTVATLPMLAAFLDEPFEPSPYAPASRLFWNELYIDPAAVPELARSPRAQATLASGDFAREAGELRGQPIIDYRRAMLLKRSVLEELARTFFAAPSSRRDDFDRFLREREDVQDYARFRAVCERRRAGWPAWPQPLRDGKIGPDDYDPEAERYHLYVQFVMREQMAALAADATSQGLRLYLDLPLGSHPDSYDSWRERDLFAAGASAGAPPDSFFPKGQNWAFRPANPHAHRQQGYRHFIACLRHHLRQAGTLRVDHVMGLHRLYWIPRGGGPADGVYVRYPADELYAILCLESHRHQAIIVGEDLGTVPQQVRSSMSRRGLRRSYVLQIEPTATSERPFGRVPADSVAALNTHDTPTFAAFWRDLDIDLLRQLEALDAGPARAERRHRKRWKADLLRFLRRRRLLASTQPDDAAVLRACLDHLAAGPVRTLLVSLEDLWLETEPQNVPGTWAERPNWRRAARYSFEEFSQRPEVADTLRNVDRLRKGKASRAPTR